MGKIKEFVAEFDRKIESELNDPNSSRDRLESIKKRGGGQYWFDAFMYIVEKYYLTSESLRKYVLGKKGEIDANPKSVSSDDKLVYDMPNNGSSVEDDYTDYARFYHVILFPNEVNGNSGALDRMTNGYLQNLVDGVYNSMAVSSIYRTDDDAIKSKRNSDPLYLAFREAGDRYKGPKTESVVNPPKEGSETQGATSSNSQKDVQRAQTQADQTPQENKVLDDGYEIAGDYTFELIDEETMSVVGPNGTEVSFPDGLKLNIGFLYRTGMPTIVPSGSTSPSEEVPKEDTTTSTDAKTTSDDYKKTEDLPKETATNTSTKNETKSDAIEIGILNPQSDNDKKVTGSLSFKKRGPKLSVIGTISGFPDGGKIDHQGEESSASGKESLIKEMLMILESKIENKYNVAVKLTVK